MSGHWPLGRGSYVRSWVHLGLALAVAMGVGAIHWSSGKPSLVTGLAMVGCRPWSLALGLVALINAGALAAFRPAPLRLLLPTPASDPELFRRLDPLRVPWIWLVPAVFAALAVLPARTEKTLTPWLIPAFLHAALLLYALHPLAMLAGLTWRKAVIPHGHLIVWSVALLEASGLPLPGAGHLLLGGRALQVGWIPSLVALILLGILTRRIYARLAPRHFIREELLDYAYPVLPNPEAQRHDLLLEVWGGSPARRHMVYLLQLVTGLHRPGDLMNAAIAWLALVMVAGTVAGLYPPGGVGNHVIALAATGMTFIAYSAARNRTLKGFPLPVGQRELTLATALYLNVLVLTTSLAIGTIQMVSERMGPAGDRNAPWGPEAGAILTFTAQLLMILNAAILFTPPRTFSVGIRLVGTALVWLAGSLFQGLALFTGTMVLTAMTHAGTSLSSSSLPILALGYQILFAGAGALLYGGRESAGEVLLLHLMDARPLPGPAFVAAAWLIPGLTCLLSLIGFLRRKEDAASRIFFGVEPIQSKTTSGEVKIPLFKT